MRPHHAAATAGVAAALLVALLLLGSRGDRVARARGGSALALRLSRLQLSSSSSSSSRTATLVRLQAKGLRPRVYVSLTTIAKSSHLLRLTLSSLLDQTMRPDAILVALNASIPMPNLERWADSSRIQILRYEQDLGPAEKYVEAVRHLRDDPSALLVVVDDDKVYPPTLLEDLLAAHERYPGAVLACRGWPVDTSCAYLNDELARSVYGHKLPSRQQQQQQQRGNGSWAGVPTDIVTGSDGYLLPASVFAGDDSLWTFPSAALQLAARMDDVWMSGRLAEKKVPRFVVPCRFEARDAAPAALLPHGRIQTGDKSRQQLNTALTKHFCSHWGHCCGYERPQQAAAVPAVPAEGAASPAAGLGGSGSSSTGSSAGGHSSADGSGDDGGGSGNSSDGNSSSTVGAQQGPPPTPGSTRAV